MRIAIVAPSPNPFLVGGAEGLWWGMLDHLNRETDHVADLIKIPVKETSLADLVAGYEAFTRLDLSGFDAVISTKYPAWMVTHPDHTVYLQHRCRGFYDWYPTAALGGIGYRGSDRQILDLLAFIERHRGQRAALPEFFERFRALAALPSARPELARHPGPVGRAVIHFLDGIGLDPSGIRRYAAIANTVKRRPDYFPAGASVSVVYHPTNKTGFHDAGEEYFFTVSRFYPSKRIDLLIDAYRKTDIPLPFKIAGTGDEEAMLRERAAGDPRFEFVGFVRDDELIELYARAIAVPFVPADEDFGYITLEAMLAGKPVITTDDAGGPLELVRDGETGIVARPDADSLAAAFQRIHAERDWARELGRRGRERAGQINWKSLFATLLGEGTKNPAPVRKRPARPRLTVLNAYGIHPPVNGGRYRIHWLYRTLARHVDIDLVTLGLREEGDDVIEVAEGYRELRVARTKAHEEADRAAQVHAHVPVYDITALENIALTPDYLTVLENSLAGSRAAVLAHPYMLAALRETGYSGPFLHESQNCEHALKRMMLPASGERERLLSLVEDAERHCCRDAALVFATCEDDARGLLAQYGGPAANTIVIPNGTDTQGIAFVAPEVRGRLKRRLRLGDRKVALFLASGHRPNLEAAEHLFTLAARMPDVAFALVGNAADAFLHRPLPENVWLVGVVSEEARNVWLEAADVALNPMLYGGGTNLKLLDYFAAGTPVVSTEIGIRGTGAEAGRHLLVAPIEGFESAIRTVLSAGPEIGRMTTAARTLVETDFDWWRLGDRLYQAITARQLV
jgi:glycosyltransferase involved in cell wall biosynthesis